MMGGKEEIETVKIQGQIDPYCQCQRYKEVEIIFSNGIRLFSVDGHWSTNCSLDFRFLNFIEILESCVN